MTRNDRIKAVLKEKKVSQQQLADRLGLHQSAVARSLNSKTDVDSAELMNAVADLTGYSFAYILSGREPHEHPIIHDDDQQIEDQIMAEEHGGNVYAFKIQALEVRIEKQETELLRVKSELEKVKAERDGLKAALREIGVGIQQSKDTKSKS